MVEFHKKESEELLKEHDKLYETLDEDRKKVFELKYQSAENTTHRVLVQYRNILIPASA